MNSLVEKIFDRSIPEPNSGCWIWEGAATYAGYGKVRVGSLKDGTRRTVQTHRVVCEAYHGLTDTQDCCHKCDTPSCVNPDHLFAGSRKDNMNDAKAKGRMSAGERHYKTKLTDAQVRAIRSDRRNSHVVAEEYGVTANHIRSIWSGVKRLAA